MTKYLLVDLANMFYRARHAAHRSSSLEDRLGFAMHVTFSSIAKCWRDLQADHVILVCDGRSWRKDYYAPYKRNRAEARAKATVEHQAEDKAFWEAHDHLVQFFSERTNCTILFHAELEADDLIAGWIQQHTTDEHMIISSDTDFVQLLANNVKQYNGITNELITTSGIFDDKGNPVKDRKTGLPKTTPDPEWLLFEKCMRGDSTDNIFSAYPGVRVKGTSKKVGLLEAFADRHNKGFAWNNMMLQRWMDHNDHEHRVLDDFNRNRQLVDLTAQPDHIRELITNTINSVQSLNRSQIGLQFIKFCGRFALNRLSEQATQFATILSSAYGEPSETTN